MSMVKAKLLAATLVVAFGSTAALANYTQTVTGPFLESPQASRDAVYNGAQNICASYGGLQSFTVNGVIQNAGYYAVNATFVCNN